MGGGGSQGSSVQTSGPPSYAKPYIIGQAASGNKPAIAGLLPEAQASYLSSNPQYYPSSTVAGFTPEQTQAQQATLNAAQSNMTNPLPQAGADQLQKTIQGDYTAQGNPYLDNVSQSVMSRILPQVQGQAELAGRFGSGSEAQALVSRGTEALAPYAFNQYAQERQNQLGAAQAAPGYAGQQASLDYGNIGQIGQVGDTRQGMNQQNINDLVARWNFGQQAPIDKLNQYASLIYGAPGSTQMSQSQAPQAGWPQLAAGGLFSALGAAGQMGWQPFA